MIAAGIHSVYGDMDVLARHPQRKFHFLSNDFGRPQEKRLLAALERLPWLVQVQGCEYHVTLGHHF